MSPCNANIGVAVQRQTAANSVVFPETIGRNAIAERFDGASPRQVRRVRGLDQDFLAGLQAGAVINQQFGGLGGGCVEFGHLSDRTVSCGTSVGQTDDQQAGADD